MWVEPVATSKLLGCPHSPHQREFCTEGLYYIISVHTEKKIMLSFAVLSECSYELACACIDLHRDESCLSTYLILLMIFSCIRWATHVACKLSTYYN